MSDIVVVSREEAGSQSHARVNARRSQLAILEEAFPERPEITAPGKVFTTQSYFPSDERLEELGKETGLSTAWIARWIQRLRCKRKRNQEEEDRKARAQNAPSSVASEPPRKRRRRKTQLPDGPSETTGSSVSAREHNSRPVAVKEESPQPYSLVPPTQPPPPPSPTKYAPLLYKPATLYIPLSAPPPDDFVPRLRPAVWTSSDDRDDSDASPPGSPIIRTSLTRNNINSSASPSNLASPPHNTANHSSSNLNNASSSPARNDRSSAASLDPSSTSTYSFTFSNRFHGHKFNTQINPSPAGTGGASPTRSRSRTDTPHSPYSPLPPNTPTLNSLVPTSPPLPPPGTDPAESVCPMANLPQHDLSRNCSLCAKQGRHHRPGQAPPAGNKGKGRRSRASSSVSLSYPVQSPTDASAPASRVSLTTPKTTFTRPTGPSAADFDLQRTASRSDSTSAPSELFKPNVASANNDATAHASGAGPSPPPLASPLKPRRVILKLPAFDSASAPLSRPHSHSQHHSPPTSYSGRHGDVSPEHHHHHHHHHHHRDRGGRKKRHSQEHNGAVLPPPPQLPPPPRRSLKKLLNP